MGSRPLIILPLDSQISLCLPLSQGHLWLHLMPTLVIQGSLNINHLMVLVKFFHALSGNSHICQELGPQYLLEDDSSVYPVYQANWSLQKDNLVLGHTSD